MFDRYLDCRVFYRDGGKEHTEPFGKILEHTRAETFVFSECVFSNAMDAVLQVLWSKVPGWATIVDPMGLTWLNVDACLLRDIRALSEKARKLDIAPVGSGRTPEEISITDLEARSVVVRKGERLTFRGCTFTDVTVYSLEDVSFVDCEIRRLTVSRGSTDRLEAGGITINGGRYGIIEGRGHNDTIIAARVDKLLGSGRIKQITSSQIGMVQPSEPGLSMSADDTTTIGWW